MKPILFSLLLVSCGSVEVHTTVPPDDVEPLVLEYVATPTVKRACKKGKRCGEWCIAKETYCPVDPN